MSGSGGVTGQASLVNQPSLNEVVQSAQRQQAVAEQKQELKAEQKRDEYISTVVKNQETENKKLRDDDPRRERPRPQARERQRPPEDQQPKIDIQM